MSAYDQGILQWVGTDVPVGALPFSMDLSGLTSVRYGTLGVYVNGILAPYDTYSVVGGVLTFKPGIDIEVGDNIRVVYAL
jgi:hypothetical protein